MSTAIVASRATRPGVVCHARFAGSPKAMRLLVSTAEPISAELLRSALGDVPDDTEAGELGDSEPLQAIQDALATFPADRIVLVEHPVGERDYREDGDLPAQARERFGLPVHVETVSR
jgi:hypothetical protein